ncbi:cupin domain-containing protein [Brevibacterium sp. BRM-1]|uniref:cupin domain-containing protein n=1 Tax=Brevibacterium sp. BRM-1 TaxID=2999062 RepID=UPI0022825B27|nr:cupin domain-containing protein [Brevibacterium sp. BRM-1]WAL40657.1 cupin domain-containing protein [Brevibacterium sp. BRM-1]
MDDERMEAAGAAHLPAGALPVNGAIEATAVEVLLEPLPQEQTVAGHPEAGAGELGSFRGAQLGVWEMTEGTATDVEADEVFIVVVGRAVIDFLDEDRSIEVGPGSIVRLAAGARTRWTVTERLRKVYLA